MDAEIAEALGRLRRMSPNRQVELAAELLKDVAWKRIHRHALPGRIMNPTMFELWARLWLASLAVHYVAWLEADFEATRFRTADNGDRSEAVMQAYTYLEDVDAGDLPGMVWG